MSGLEQLGATKVDAIRMVNAAASDSPRDIDGSVMDAIDHNNYDRALPSSHPAPPIGKKKKEKEEKKTKLFG
jgi:hypothetical protein